MRQKGSSRLMQTSGLPAAPCGGTASDDEPGPLTNHGSLPRPTDDRFSTQPVDPFSKPLFGKAK